MHQGREDFKLTIQPVQVFLSNSRGKLLGGLVGCDFWGIVNHFLVRAWDTIYPTSSSDSARKFVDDLVFIIHCGFSVWSRRKSSFFKSEGHDLG